VNDFLDAAKFGCIFAIPAGLLVGSIVFGGLRLMRHMRDGLGPASRQRDQKIAGWFAAGAFTLVYLPLFCIGMLFSGSCGTNHVFTYPSPDGMHKLVVFNWDCGATTDFSFNVSLLSASKALSRDPGNIYSHYHQCPDQRAGQRNFDVEWQDSSHVNVKVEGAESGMRNTDRDGVTVSIENLK
jgi:hypothetical protein